MSVEINARTIAELRKDLVEQILKVSDIQVKLEEQILAISEIKEQVSKQAETQETIISKMDQNMLPEGAGLHE